MLYLFYGLEKFLINKQIKQVINEHNIDDINIVTYNLDEDKIKDFIEDASTISMFGDKKLIIGENATFLTGSGKLDDSDLKLVEDYIKNINPDTIIILVVNNDKLDERKKIVKNIANISTKREFNKNLNINNIVRDMFDNYKIDANDLNYFIDRVGKDLLMLEKESEKLKIFKIEEKIITKDDITNLTTQNIDIDIFGLIEKIVAKDKSKALEIYHEMLKHNEEPIKIIVMLSNQFRIIYQAKVMYQKGYTEANIASELKIHPYRIKLALEKGRKFDNEILLTYLKRLADLDISIKSGTIDKELGLELFIIEL